MQLTKHFFSKKRKERKKTSRPPTVGTEHVFVQINQILHVSRKGWEGYIY